jgi:molybdopterin molybdotransferase
MADVRMRGFAQRSTVGAALRWVDEHTKRLSHETVPLADASGRVLAETVSSNIDVPLFRRAMMDGFAVQAEDTLGAGGYNHLPLELVGEVLPGESFVGTVERGQAVKIMTGAAVPNGANAVLPVEKTDFDGHRVSASGEVSPGKHIGQIGEDIAAGTRVLESGRVLRPQDVGVLSSIGAGSVSVVRQPRVRIVVTGNELLPPGSMPAGVHIVDSNSPMLAALTRRDGGLSINPGIVPDSPQAIAEALQDDADIVLVSGGSSVGQEDHAPILLARDGELGIHGIAMRPSSPAGMGRMGSRLVFLLPGNPVSCLCAYDFFAGRAIRIAAGRRAPWPYRSTRLPLLRKLVSTVGRVDYARVKIVEGKVDPIAISGASVLSSTTRADGFVIVPSDSEGFPEDAEVEVFLYDTP